MRNTTREVPLVLLPLYQLAQKELERRTLKLEDLCIGYKASQNIIYNSKSDALFSLRDDTLVHNERASDKVGSLA